MYKQTTIEEFKKGMAEILPDFTDNSKDGKYEWVKGDIINPERSFSRSWLMTVNMRGEEGCVKEATFTLTYDPPCNTRPTMGARLEFRRKGHESPCIGMGCLSPQSMKCANPLTFFSRRSNRSWNWPRNLNVASGS